MINLGWIPGYLQTQGRMLHQSGAHRHFEEHQQDKVPTWQYVNVTRGYICPCKFNSKDEALADFIKYKDEYYKVEFVDMVV